MLPPVSALPPHLLPSELSRQLTRSPVNFREGRRSSDGLVSPVAFQQRLYCDQETGNGGLLPLEQVSLFIHRTHRLIVYRDKSESCGWVGWDVRMIKMAYKTLVTILSRACQ